MRRPAGAAPTAIGNIEDSEILITGGHGFIGASLAARLVRRGNRLTLLDSGPYAGSTAHALDLARHRTVRSAEMDVRDPAALATLGISFDHIVHAAGFLGIRKVVEHPVHTLDVNIRGTQACLELAAAQRALRRFVLFSTSEVYGRDADGASESDAACIDADSVRWGYAASKLAAEFLGMAFRAERGVPVVTVRPFNVYGPYRVGYNGMSTMIGRALRGEVIQVSGDGSQRRCWCYISDLLDGLELCLGTPAAVGETINLGNDRTELSIRALAERIVARTGSTSEIQIMGDDTPDVRSRRPSLEKARRLLGYDPRVGVDEGIDRLVAAVRRAGHLAGQVV